ncbi:MAG: LPS-assembly protein LptD [Desulfobacteraceae bacterium]|nr:MAG: LPS-assembly protein LptD [Desulfobacteraceae bacterium]
MIPPLRIGSNQFGIHLPLSIALILIAVVFGWIQPEKVCAQIGAPIEEDPDKPWLIEADEVGYDQATEQYIARGNVTIRKMDVNLSADYVEFDHKAMRAVAVGDVVMYTGEDILIGNSIDIDLATQTGTIYQGSLFIKESHFYIKGDKLQKTGKDSYAAESATISSCDSLSPAWKITGRKLNVRLEGYGTVRHGMLWARNVPVLYSPFLAFPTKRKRQTGFLPPQFGSSSRNGFFYIQPFFWAINESSDATFFWHHLPDRGEKVGGEYRYILNDGSKGSLMFDFLEDSQIDDGQPENTNQWGFSDIDGIRPNNDRYWFRMKADQSLPYDFSAKLDLDIVSDQDYLVEFETGETGFEWTNAYFEETFGRGLDDFNERIRRNQLNIRKGWDKFDLNATALWYDDVLTRRQSEVDQTLQSLPVINFNGTRQPLLVEPLYFDLDTEYIHYYREDGDTLQRTDLNPRLYLPLRFRNYFSFEPSLGLRETLYYQDRIETPSTDEERFAHREIFDFRADFLTEFFNVFRLDFAGIDRIKHNIRPQVVYSYTPRVDQDDLPAFDDTDRIGEQNSVNYSLTTSLTSRSARQIPEAAKKDPAEEGEGEEVKPEYDYQEFLRLRLDQTYDIKAALDDRPRPFSTVNARLDFIPFRYLSFEGTASFDPYESELVEHNTAMTLSDVRGDRFLLEHRFTKDSSESIYFDGRLKIIDQLFAFGAYEQNLLDNVRIQSSLGGSYTAQCWSFDLRYIDEVTDRRYEFVITLHGLGQFRRGFMGRVVESPLNIL